jgi:alpha,alpha-trehalase
MILKYNLIMIGALLCDMVDTAKGIIENFICLVCRYGYVPNGNRIYYLLRSQPPLLSFMAKTYYTYTDDFDFIKENIKVNCIYNCTYSYYVN